MEVEPMKTAIVIPARYASRRLPGKPLLRQTGKYLIQHVYERACEAKLASTVVVATDDSRIMTAVQSFGGRVVLTRRDHPSGTDRVAEAARSIDADIIVNLQGDEPLIDPKSLDRLPELLQRDASTDMATLAVPLHSLEQYRDPGCVKVALDTNGRALYFSRAPIPFVRDGEPDLSARPARFLQHLGLYAYRREFLFQLAILPQEPLEHLEKLEQLRVLALGKSILVGIVEHTSIGVDTYDDYQKFVELNRQSRETKAA
jgi:3-deoxy-manno-octulosonate cytidylyltransferase (CMP-KDO synthetase)